MPIKITYFVHGTTTDNEKDLATGWLDGELSEKGIKQAKELGDLVSSQHFDVVFCSDLKRAVDSAELGFGSKYQIIKDKRLREANYGDFTQTLSDDFKSMNQMLDYVEKRFPNGESYRDVEKRMADFIDFLKQNYSGKHIAIVAHQGPQLALEVLANKKTWEKAIQEDWRNTPVVVASGDTTGQAKSWQPGWDYVIE